VVVGRISREVGAPETLTEKEEELNDRRCTGGFFCVFGVSAAKDGFGLNGPPMHRVGALT